MSTPRPMRDILDELADRWGIPRETMMARMKSPNERRQTRLSEGLYRSRPVTTAEADSFNLTSETVVICSGDGTDKHGWLYVSPSSYKDRDGIERKTVTAASYEYLGSMHVKQIDIDHERTPAVMKNPPRALPWQWHKKRNISN